MNKLRIILNAVTFAAAMSGCLVPAAHGADRPVIRGSFIESPPLDYTNDAGQAEGTFIDLAEDIADRAGYGIRWQELPIERVYLYLEAVTIARAGPDI